MGSIAAQSWCEFPPGRHFGAQWTGPCPAPIITFRLATTSAPRRRRADLPTGVHNHISTAGAALDPSMTHLPPRPSLSAPLGRYMYIYISPIYIRFLNVHQHCCRSRWARYAPFAASSSVDESAAPIFTAPSLPPAHLPLPLLLPFSWRGNYSRSGEYASLQSVTCSL